MAFYKHGRARLTIEFRDPLTDQLVDPSIVKIWIADVGQAVVTYTYGTDVQVVKDAVGKYHVLQDLNNVGQVAWGALPDGTYKGSARKVLTVLDVEHA